MIAGPLWHDGRHRLPSPHQPRRRRDCLGELVQTTARSTAGELNPVIRFRPWCRARRRALVSSLKQLILTAGIISHVSGGLGIFDTIILVGLSNEVPGNQILAALLVFRVMYFLVPLVTACAVFGGLEAIQARRRITRVSQGLAGWLAPAARTVLAGCTFIGGAVLLFSNATPESGTRLELVSAVLQLPVIEASHFVGSVIGLFLLLLSSRPAVRSAPHRGSSRRPRRPIAGASREGRAGSRRRLSHRAHSPRSAPLGRGSRARSAKASNTHSARARPAPPRDRPRRGNRATTEPCITARPSPGTCAAKLSERRSR
jgi:hypothetical protein